MYVAVKGGEKAIDAAHELLAQVRRGDPALPAISVDQIVQQLALAVDRTMSEGSLYDRDLAALAVRQPGRVKHQPTPAARSVSRSSGVKGFRGINGASPKGAPPFIPRSLDPAFARHSRNPVVLLARRATASPRFFCR